MAYVKNSHPTTHPIDPHYLKINKTINTDGVEGVIIVDILNLATPPASTTTVFAPVVWLKIENDYKITVLSKAPVNGLEELTTAPFSVTILNQKAGEIFVVQHTSDTYAERASVEGVQFGTTDVVFAKIVQTSTTDEVTLFKIK
jgi:hypothetical protein